MKEVLRPGQVKRAFHTLTPEVILDLLETSVQTGLLDSKASKRLEIYGLNELISRRKTLFLEMVLRQFKSFMILLLLLAALVSGAIGFFTGEGWTDTLIILGILCLNAVIGAIQEWKAETSLAALRKLSAPTASVIRDGAIKSIPANQVVPGDLILLETGDIVPADLRLVEAVNLRLQEASLTGESMPVDKRIGEIPEDGIPLNDQFNMAFAGTLVTHGRGKGVTVATGMATKVGEIAQLLQQTEDTTTPLSKKLSHLGKILGFSAVIICAIIMAIGLLYGNSAISMFMTAISLAVAAIPEGLPAVSTVVLAVGVQRLVQKNAVIRNLPAVETLGSATVICSDKTGTLTQNKMTLEEFYPQALNQHHEGKHPATPLLNIALLCNDAHLVKDEKGAWISSGDPTETAILDFGIRFGIMKHDLEQQYPRVDELPFDAVRKRMTTVHKWDSRLLRIHAKGGVEEILLLCNRIQDNGEVRPIHESDREQIRRYHDFMAERALRVLAVAFKEIPQDCFEVESMENELIFSGLIGMRDPVRPEAVHAVSQCRSAGIRPVMITGDHPTTAVAIAREVGIFQPGDHLLTGVQLEQINDQELEQAVSSCSVYARVAPEHKVRIVKAWQQQHAVVAMTGDGVNDAPALKQADIGAAMGLCGTEVAKGAADMILTDDNFATIVAAVEEGRRIYDNILKAIQFLLSCNIGELFLILVASLLNLGTPLLPVHILWVNLVTDSLPALALSLDPADKDIMRRKPRKIGKGLLDKVTVRRILYQGVLIGTMPLIAFWMGLNRGGLAMGQTMAFACLIFTQLLHVQNLHSPTLRAMATNPLKNKVLPFATMLSAGLALALLLIPKLQNAFNLVPLDSTQWLWVVGLSFVPLIVVDVMKALKWN